MSVSVARVGDVCGRCKLKESTNGRGHTIKR
jgi:hypothetical protein